MIEIYISYNQVWVGIPMVNTNTRSKSVANTMLGCFCLHTSHYTNHLPDNFSVTSKKGIHEFSGVLYLVINAWEPVNNHACLIVNDHQVNHKQWLRKMKIVEIIKTWNKIQICIDKSGDVKFNDDTHLPGTSRLIYANLSEFQKLILSNGMTLHDFWIWGTHFPFSVVQ